LELLRAKRHADAAKTAREWQTEKKQDAQKRSLKRKAKEDPIAMDTPPTKLQRPATMVLACVRLYLLYTFGL
jgi:hypothetical protein